MHYCEAFPDARKNHSIPICSLFSPVPELYHQNHRSGRSSREECNLYNRENETRLVSDIEQCTDGTYLISGEDISILDREAFVSMRDFFSRFFDEMKIVCCIREPVALIRSIWQQEIKGGTSSVMATHNMGYSFLMRCNAIRLLIDTFGQMNTMIFRYEDAVASHDLVAYFARSFLNIPSFKYDLRPQNQAISVDAAVLLSAYNRLAPAFISNYGNVDRNQDMMDLLAECPGRKFTFEIPLSDSDVTEINNALKELEGMLAMELYPPLEYRGDPAPDAKNYFSDAALDYVIRIMMELARQNRAAILTSEERCALLSAAVELEKRNPELAGQLAGIAHKSTSDDPAARNLRELYSFRGLKKIVGKLGKTEQHFDPVHYLLINPDVLEAGVDPWKHYCEYGKKEGRDAAFISSEPCRDVPAAADGRAEVGVTP